MIVIACKTRAEVDLSAICGNAKKIKELTDKSVKLCGVVKADAYGHGAVAVCDALYMYCDMFAVALTDEGAQLRYSGIDKEILLLTPVKNDAARAVWHNLTLTVCCLEDIRLIERACRELNRQVNVHIKYNSGMNRLGCCFNDLDDMLRLLLSSKHINLTGFFSHFFRPEDDRSRELQYGNFVRALQFVRTYKCDITAHISASGGILSGRRYDLDMVRAGIMLYGYKPFESGCVELKRALKIEADAIQVRKLKKGESLLYGGYTLNEDADVCIARLGYADGFLRHGLKGNYNNLCMDISAVQAKDDLSLGDFEKIAREYGTISYEVLCNVTKRSEMVYLR